MNAAKLPTCSNCTYFISVDEVCMHRLQRCADVDPLDWCSLHSPTEHVPALCCGCEDGPCEYAQRSLA